MSFVSIPGHENFSIILNSRYVIQPQRRARGVVGAWEGQDSAKNWGTLRHG